MGPSVSSGAWVAEGAGVAAGRAVGVGLGVAAAFRLWINWLYRFCMKEAEVC